MIKLWVGILLILFIAVAGYQFVIYQDKLTASTAEKERLNSLLTRERSHVHGGLRVMKGLAQTHSNESSKGSNLLKQGWEDGSTELEFSAAKNAHGERQLIAYLQQHPQGQTLTVSAFACANEVCEFSARYAGKQEDFTRLLDDLQRQSWWRYREAERSSNIHNGIAQIDITFTTRLPVRQRHEDGLTS
jgi:hypothetical protein